MLNSSLDFYTVVIPKPTRAAVASFEILNLNKIGLKLAN